MSGNLEKRIKKAEKRKALKDKIEKALTFHIGNYEGFILFLPLVPFVWVAEKVEDLFKKSQKWSDKKAEKVIYEVLVNAVDVEDGELILSDNAFRWKANLPISLRAWANIYKYDILDYLVEKFEMEGYTKEKQKCFAGGYDIIFKPIDKNAES